MESAGRVLQNTKAAPVSPGGLGASLETGKGELPLQPGLMC